MVRRDTGSRPFPLRTMVLLLALGALPGVAPAERRVSPVLDGGTATDRALAIAERSAAGKLSGERCRTIFSELRDGSGRTLQERLDVRGETAEAHLAGVLYYEGDGHPACARDVFAFTAPGSAVVFLCSERFRRLAHRDPGLSGALLLHESLHTLGLGENPPDSKSITAFVVERCGK